MQLSIIIIIYYYFLLYCVNIHCWYISCYLNILTQLLCVLSMNVILHLYRKHYVHKQKSRYQHRRYWLYYTYPYIFTYTCVNIHRIKKVLKKSPLLSHVFSTCSSFDLYHMSKQQVICLADVLPLACWSQASPWPCDKSISNPGTTVACVFLWVCNTKVKEFEMTTANHNQMLSLMTVQVQYVYE